MSKILLKNIKFLYEINEFYNKNKDKIIDIILFGSVLKGKENPRDIDLLILFKEKKNLDLSYELKKRLKNFNLDINSKSYNELFDNTFKAREAILSEGFSLIQNKFISSGLGFSNFVLFRYELKKLSKSYRMRFYYSLYGRGKERGMIKKLNLIKFSETILLSPIEHEAEIVNYLDAWKLKYIMFPILIPKRIRELFEGKNELIKKIN